MTYAESIDFLYGLRLFGAKLGLENAIRLASIAGNPQNCLRFIHVAGTNGKGSTCAMIESIYRASGLRVGLFTSPHLVSFRERIQTNRRLISKEDVVRLVAKMQLWMKQLPVEFHPTFFEVVTVMALQYFVEQACDLVIWETGLGGRLDATNIVTPLASVITNIQYDHQKWLGNTLPQIAAEKAGIIKPGVPVITAAEDPDALCVIRDKAQEKVAPLRVVTPREAHNAPLDQIHLPLLGEHQYLNAALALATVRELSQRIPVSEESIREGLEKIQWAGRFQVIRRGERTILLDGAHNPAGVEMLRAALARHFPNRSLTLVFGVMCDKDWAEMGRILAPLAEELVLAPVQSERGANPSEVAARFHQFNPSLRITHADSARDALARTAGASLVVVTGSLHFVGEALEALDVLPRAGTERDLNEWDLQPMSHTARGDGGPRP